MRRISGQQRTILTAFDQPRYHADGCNSRNFRGALGWKMEGVSASRRASLSRSVRRLASAGLIERLPSGRWRRTPDGERLTLSAHGSKALTDTSDGQQQPDAEQEVRR